MGFRQKSTGGRTLRKYKNLHEKKADDIKRSLVRRSNMRRKYFKMLEQEGEAVPEKETNTKSGNVSGDEAQIENDKKSDNRELEDDLDEEGDFFKTDTKEKKKEAPNPVKKQTEKKPFTHTDRLKLIKERKKNQREEYENRQKNKLKEKEEKESLRIKHKKQMNQFTKKRSTKNGTQNQQVIGSD